MKKCFAVLLTLSSTLVAAEFMTGQAARAIVGQRTFTSQDISNTGSQFTLGGVGGLAFANDTLFVTDANRIGAAPIQNRVLIYRSMSQMIPAPTAPIRPPTYQRCPLCVGDPNVGNGASVVLGQTDFSGTSFSTTQSSFRTPTAVASDGTVVAVADTDNNRVLIWKSIPSANGQPADIVLGQPDFKTVRVAVTDNKSFRGPQGLWIQGGRLFVADTQNHRVMVWNSIPTSNYQAADYVLGQPNFNTAPQPDLTQAKVDAKANNMLNPVSVTSDGTRLFVTDLGHNRVLIWNSIPAQTQQPADMVVGQPNLNGALSNNVQPLCPATGKDDKGNDTFPGRCAATLSFPRFALSDGKHLFVADGGNDRILVFNQMPGQNGMRADEILGQPDEFSDNITDSSDFFHPDANIGRSSADTIRTPMSLAWDGTNLYASDPFDRRVLVFTPGENLVPVNGVRNAASRTVFAVGTVTFSGTIKADDTVTVKIAGKDYQHKVVKDDTFPLIIADLVKQINANGGDPNVFARGNPDFNQLVLTAKLTGQQGNGVAYSVSTSSAAQLTAATSGATLNGGQNAAELAPGTLITIFGSNLSDNTASADPNATQWPGQLGGVELYIDGMRAPLSFVSPSQINAQLPFEVNDASSVSAYLRILRKDGTTQVSSAIAVPVVSENPGIFAGDNPDGSDPRPVFAFHASSNAIAVVDIGGTIKAGDVATVTVEDRSYSYTVQSSDTTTIVRDALVAAINANPDEKVTAAPTGQYDRIILRAKVAGPDGNGIAVGGSTSSGAQITVSALQNATCCASTAGAPVTAENPAAPGEVISIFATGLGIVQPEAAKFAENTGVAFNGPAFNTPNQPVDDAQVGGKTANVLFAGLKPGLIGVYEVQLQLNPDIPTNPQTQMFIAQDVFTSNIVTIPVVNPNAPPQ